MLEATYGARGEDPTTLHARIAERTKLLLRVRKLLQEGGFGDSSEEEADEVAAADAESRLRRKMTPAAKSQPSDPPPAPPSPQPLAPQARAFMEEKGLDALSTRGDPSMH